MGAWSWSNIVRHIRDFLSSRRDVTTSRTRYGQQRCYFRALTVVSARDQQPLRKNVFPLCAAAVRS
eukprot:1184696-Prorocentrum_minimum.AAC.3